MAGDGEGHDSALLASFVADLDAVDGGQVGAEATGQDGNALANRVDADVEDVLGGHPEADLALIVLFAELEPLDADVVNATSSGWQLSRRAVAP